MKNYLAYASEIYPLKIKDVLNLADSQNNDSSALPAEKVVILLGNADANQPDTLLCGRERLNRLQTEGQTYADVCLAYHTLPPLAGFFANMIKPIKRRYYATSANTYHTPLSTITRNRLNRGIRNAQNAYQWSNKKWATPEEERVKRYQELYNSLKQNGYDDASPMLVLLNRAWGVKDQLLQGHHRLSICQELGIEEIAVNFWTAPKSPRFIAALYKIYAKCKNADLKS